MPHRLRLRCFTTLFLFAIAGFLLPAHAQTWQRALTVASGYRGSWRVAQDFYMGLTVADATGNTYVIGFFDSTITLGSTTLLSSRRRQAFVGKVSPAGQWLWARASSSTSQNGTCQAQALTLTPTGDVVIAGSFSDTVRLGTTTLISQGRMLNGNGDVFVAKLSPAGAWQWVTTTTHPNQQGSGAGANGIAADATGNILVTGGVGHSATFGATTLTTSSISEAFVARLSVGGSWQWAVASTGSQGSPFSGSTGHRVLADSQGNAVVVGSYPSAITLGTTTLTRRNAIGGTAFIARVSPTGGWQWATDINSPNSIGSGLAVDGAGNVLVTGSFRDTATLGATTLLSTAAPGYYSSFLARLSAAGAWQWATEAAGTPAPLGSYGGWLLVNPAGNILLTGTTTVQGPPRLPGAVFVAMYTPAGTEVWRTNAPASGPRPITGVANLEATGPDEVRITGQFKDTLSFGPFTLGSTDSLSLYVAHLNTRSLATPAEIGAAPFTLAPNPAHHAAQLTNAPAAEAEIVDALGRTVRAANLELRTANRLDLTGLPPGLYVVRCGPQTRRLVVE